MSMDYSGGPYDVSTELFLEIMKYRMSVSGKGNFVKGIPGTNPDRRRRVLSMLNMDTGQQVTARLGEPPFEFSQQSMSKPTAACYAMKLLPGGRDEFKRHLGNDFSGKIYNGVNFIDGTTIPQNYSDNIGALKVWDLIASHTPANEDPFAGYLRWFRGLFGANVEFKPSMAYGEYGEGGANWTLLKELGIQQGTPRWERVYLSYCKACAVHVTAEQMAVVFGVLANYGKNPKNGQFPIPADIASHVMDGMREHGAYNESHKYWKSSMLWSKTGVDGGIMGRVAAHSRWVFCCQHPELNAAGNSGEALKWIKDLARLRLVWPTHVNPVYQLPPHKDSGEALDELLRQAMRPATISTLEANIQAHVQANKLDFKSGFYLKLNPKGKKLTDGTPLLDATDKYGVRKRYYFMPDTHGIHKIVVEPITPLTAVQPGNPFFSA